MAPSLHRSHIFGLRRVAHRALAFAALGFAPAAAWALNKPAETAAGAREIADEQPGVQPLADGAQVSQQPTLRAVGEAAVHDAVGAIAAQSEASAPPALIPSLPAAQLTIWRSPLFQQRFTESYMAETDVEPPAALAEQQLMQKVMAQMAANQLVLAATVLEQEVARNRACSALVDYTLGNIYFQQERLRLAGLAYQAAVTKFPKFRRAWKNLGMVHLRQAEHARAQAALARVIELGGADAQTFGMLGFVHATLENNVAAESAYRMAMLLEPASPDWPMGLARTFFKQERFPEAVALLGQLIAANPERVDLWVLQASAYIGMKQPLKAAENYKAVAALGKATPEHLLTLGDIYLTEQLFAPAAESYVQALDRDPAIDAARIIRSAKFLAARGALEEARALAQHIEQVKGGALDATGRKDLLKIQARIATANGSSDEELQVLEQIIALDPLDGEALIMLGQGYNRAGDPDKAVLYFERAAGIEAFEAEAKVRQAQVLVQKGDYDAALPLLRRAQQIKPRDNVQELLDQVQRVARGRN